MKYGKYLLAWELGEYRSEIVGIATEAGLDLILD